MAWVKVPKENHPVFHACLPPDGRVSTVNMFGGVVAKVNGRMFAGLFGRGAIVKLAPPEQKVALAIDGAEPFDPMGTGRGMRETVLLPESIIDEPDELRRWLRKALDHVTTLPPKGKKPARRSATKVRRRA